MTYDKQPPALDFNRDIWSVSRLNRELSAVLQGSFPLLWVQGEVSNLARPASGHLYFSLKDQAAQMRCVMFRNKRLLAAVTPANGQQLLVRARLAFYEPRGDCQLIVEHAEPAGEGALRMALEALKRRLAAEGLFDESSKRPLPPLPRQIGLVTSASGAALHDLLTVLGRRWPLTPLLIYPAQVQGEGAAESLITALERANARADCDLLILARGGGSFEDLMAFNDEGLVRKIRASAIPVLTGIGHEVDLSLADLAADRRAATPSAAAECATPAQLAMRERLLGLEGRLVAKTQTWLDQVRRRLINTERHLRLLHPRNQLQQQAQRLDRLEQRLCEIQGRILRRQHDGLNHLQQRLAIATPARTIERERNHSDRLQGQLSAAAQRLIEQRRQRLQAISAALNARSPLATLGRGYALVSSSDGKLLKSRHQVQPNARLSIRLADGTITARAEEQASSD
ncbi:exodeoxyribonuclease VII large subunit [Thiorhodovibrio frisius]|uniref:Exodeoxyribonuclease 7 large subunit n=1 Tax=Thiorhodovibrio frisius TaxID=631362 RepID=H8YYJ0_9GAMM|nr:exodeoxyribonuclease VII large subunit [Thiorhodovibrio frisius]EIC23516.1 exodeoxyribonuclease VII, large subunit [Thiorhodovibrio frisius]WPL23397.1 Exodeoxyribonuclease 7 large subunit [Thiorhodovibrio frisius]